jgi:hypothetical protein
MSTPGQVVPEDAGNPPTPAAPESHAARLERVFGSLFELLSKPGPEFPKCIEELTAEIAAIVAQDPDRSLYLVLRPRADQFERYSINHALQCAVVCQLLAHRVGWSDEDTRVITHAALTMNIGMTSLQCRLAMQRGPVTEEQSEAIDRHASKGAEMLREAGVQDGLWIEIVSRHHARPDADSNQLTREASLAVALRKIDEFTAKLSARATRPALPTRMAMREIFGGGTQDPLVSAIIKEFGLYPPGTLVRLASGHTAVVMRRGERVHTPRVVCLVNRNGSELPEPLYRDSTDKRFAIVGEAEISVRMNDEELFALDAAATAPPVEASAAAG